MAFLLPLVKQRFFDSNGDPLSGGKLYSYVAGTSTLLATYTDDTGATPNANPVVLDANGEADVWISTALYKFVLKDSDDVTQWTVDNVQSAEGAAFDSVSPMTTLGDIIYGGASGTGTRLGGNTTTTKKFLQQTGDGAASAAPTWGQPAFSDVTGQAALASQVSGQLPIANGGTGAATQTAGFDALSPMTTSGDIIYGGASGTGTRLPKGTDGQVLTLASGVPSWASAAGGGGGGSITWSEQANAPVKEVFNNIDSYTFDDEDQQQYLYTILKVPNTYVAGSQINLRSLWYSALTTGNVLFQTLATLIRTGTDPAEDTTNQRTSTNSATTVNGTGNVITAVTCDLSDSSGQINSVAVSAGDLILVRMTRDTSTDTAAGAAYLLSDLSEVTYV